jgi:hypothetical protein
MRNPAEQHGEAAVPWWVAESRSLSGLHEARAMDMRRTSDDRTTCQACGGRDVD